MLNNCSTCKLLLIDTHLCADTIEFNDGKYSGSFYNEADNEEQLKIKLKSSYNNLISFWPTKETLERQLLDIGFTTIYEVIPYHYANRTFFIAEH